MFFACSSRVTFLYLNWLFRFANVSACLVISASCLLSFSFSLSLSCGLCVGTAVFGGVTLFRFSSSVTVFGILVCVEFLGPSMSSTTIFSCGVCGSRDPILAAFARFSSSSPLYSSLMRLDHSSAFVWESYFLCLISA